MIGKGKVLVNIANLDLVPIFNALSKEEVNNYKELAKICAKYDVALKKLSSVYEYNNSKALGVIEGGMMADSVILFNKFFLCYSPKPYVARYDEIEHNPGWINKNKFKGKSQYIELSKEEKKELKDLIKNSEEKIVELEEEITESVKEEKISINIQGFEFAPLFNDLSKKEVNNYEELAKICAKYDVALKKLSSVYEYNDTKALGVIEGGMLEDSVILFNDFFLCCSLKSYIARYDEVEHNPGWVYKNDFVGKCQYIELSKEEKKELKDLVDSSEIKEYEYKGRKKERNIQNDEDYKEGNIKNRKSNIHCPKCKEKLINGKVKFCSNCGQKIGEERAQYTKEKWYRRKWFIIPWLILFFPIGLYLMWKSNEFTKKSKTIVTIFLAILVVISGAYSEDEQIVNIDEEEVSNEDEQIINIDEEKVLDYEVVEIETDHIESARRYVYNVVINEKGNVAELKETIKKIIENAKENKKFNGLMLFLYDYEEFIDGMYTLGRVLYAPDRDWGKSLQVAPGDYDRLEFAWTLREKDWDKQLSEQEVEVWKEFDKLLWSDYYSDKDDDELFEIVAEKFNISASDVEDIVFKKNIWTTMDISE